MSTKTYGRQFVRFRIAGRRPERANGGRKEERQNPHPEKNRRVRHPRTSCERWHTGPCLDFSYNEPFYWGEEHEKTSKKAKLFPRSSKNRYKTFLDEDYCAINAEDFFVRGLIHLPILGVSQTFCWGVWGSLSRENFHTLLEKEDDPRRIELPPMFSWLSSQIEEYPDTLSLKMYAHIQEPGQRPNFRLERTDHPLSVEYHKGISPERLKDIMLRRLRDLG